MADIIEAIEETEEEKRAFSDLPDTPTEQPQSPETPVTPVVDEVVKPEETVMPDKYKDKSVEELVQMHQNAEKALGKQGGEVGELRKLVDDYITSQVPEKPTEPTKPKEDVDFFTKPQEAVDSAIDNHPAIKEAQNAAADLRLETARTHLLAKHPTIIDTLNDPKFAEWVQASPYRKKQYIQAQVNTDLEAVDELMTGWGERQGFVGKTVQAETDSRKDSVKDASTGSTRSSSGGSKKPLFRRADIIKLIKTDPERYESLLPEIEQAYLDGRVK